MLSLLLALAQPLAAVSESLRLTSMQTQNLELATRAGRNAPDVCFIHVGKAGGDSIFTMLMEAKKRGEIASYMETHDGEVQTEVTWNHCKWFGGLKPTACKLHRTDDSPRAAQIHFKEHCGACLLEACKATGHPVMWVRDPISRLISTWNADSGTSTTNAGRGKEVLSAAMKIGVPISHEGDGTPFVDLGKAVDYIATLDQPVFHLMKLFESDGHIIHDTNWFMGAQHRDDVKTCQTVTAKLNWACVGRTERFEADWKRCWSSGLGLTSPAPELEHTHHWDKAGSSLSPKSVNLLRKFFANEITCLKALHEEGHIPNDGWMEEIQSDAKVYSY